MTIKVNNIFFTPLTWLSQKSVRELSNQLNFWQNQVHQGSSLADAADEWEMSIKESFTAKSKSAG